MRGSHQTVLSCQILFAIYVVGWLVIRSRFIWVYLHIAQNQKFNASVIAGKKIKLSFKHFIQAVYFIIEQYSLDMDEKQYLICILISSNQIPPKY